MASWKISPFLYNRRYIFKWLLFHCRLSFPGQVSASEYHTSKTLLNCYVFQVITLESFSLNHEKTPVPPRYPGFRTCVSILCWARSTTGSEAEWLSTWPSWHHPFADQFTSFFSTGKNWWKKFKEIIPILQKLLEHLWWVQTLRWLEMHTDTGDLPASRNNLCQILKSEFVSRFVEGLFNSHSESTLTHLHFTMAISYHLP